MKNTFTRNVNYEIKRKFKHSVWFDLIRAHCFGMPCSSFFISFVESTLKVLIQLFSIPFKRIIAHLVCADSLPFICIFNSFHFSILFKVFCSFCEWTSSLISIQAEEWLKYETYREEKRKKKTKKIRIEQKVEWMRLLSK